MDIIELKNKAKDTLKDHYKDSFIITLIVIILSLITSLLNRYIENSAIKVTISIITTFIETFFTLGTTSFYLKLARGEDTSYKELFAHKDLLITGVLISLIIAIFVFLWGLLLIVPGIIAAISYSYALYIFIDNNDIEIMDAINKSKEMMMGHKKDFFFLIISFLGWLILSLLSFGILLLYVTPYINMTITLFYEEIKEAK